MMNDERWLRVFYIHHSSFMVASRRPAVKRIVMLLAVVGLFMALNSVGADSLWERRNPYFANMFWDTKARRVGDVVTIIFNETTNFTGQEQKQQEKDTNLNAASALTMGYTAGTSTKRNFTGNFTGSTTSTRALTGKSNWSTSRNF